MPVAVQSATIPQLLGAVQTVLAFGNGVQPGLSAAGGFPGVDETYIQEAYTGFRPRSGEPIEITYGIVRREPERYPGAGRMGYNIYYVLEVKVFIRYEADWAGVDTQWASNPTQGLWVACALIDDVLINQFLFSAYDPNTHLPTGTPITVEGLQQTDCPSPQKPASGQSDRGEDVGGYGSTSLYYQIKCPAPLTIPPVN